MEAGAARMRSAAAWVAAAVVLVVVVGVVYLRPSPGAPRGGGPAAGAPPVAPGVEALSDLSFADARRGSVTIAHLSTTPGAAETAYVTSDGGATWKRGAHLDYPTASMVVQRAVGGVGTNRISDDGGRTWRALTVPDRRAIVTGAPMFVDAAHGWWLLQEANGPTFSATLWRTTDGGRTWPLLPLFGVPHGDILSQARFLDQLRGVLVAVRDDRTSELFVTGDGGLTWRRALTVSSPLPDSPTVRVVLLARRATLVAWLTVFSPGPSTPARVSATYALTSTDGGLTWGTPRAGPELQAATSPVLDDRGRLLVIENRRLWISDDDGLTWTARVIQAPEGVMPFGLALAGRTLLALASGGRSVESFEFVDTLLRSVDGGAHWDLVRLP